MSDTKIEMEREIDFDGFSIEALRDLYRQLPAIIRARETADRAARVERVLEAAKSEGMTRDEIRALKATLSSAGSTKRVRRDGAGAMYRDPGSDATWTGRGRKPAWVKAHEERGGALDELKID